MVMLWDLATRSPTSEVLSKTGDEGSLLPGTHFIETVRNYQLTFQNEAVTNSTWQNTTVCVLST